jgi:hypothetical protein
VQHIDNGADGQRRFAQAFHVAGFDNGAWRVLHGEQEAERSADVADSAHRPAVAFTMLNGDGLKRLGELDDRWLRHGRRGNPREVTWTVE